MGLFNWGPIELHSGDTADWIIDCDALSDADLDCLANIAIRHVGPFDFAIGIPRGGVRLAAAMGKYAKPLGTVRRVIICDDVLTTGKSMEQTRLDLFPNWFRAGMPYRDGDQIEGWVKGLVIFARGPHPSWVTPLWSQPRI